MLSRYTKLRWRRGIRHQQQALEEVGEAAGKQLRRHIFRRWQNLREVRRFVFGWILLVGLLGWGVVLQTNGLRSYYQIEVPKSGGVLREGIIGQLTNTNPIFATSDADQSAARLIFSRLLRYDDNGRLVGDLATRWSVSRDGRTYKVNLRRDVTWHDGEQLTSQDVVFTYQLIQHPDTRSYLNASWQDIEISARGDYTVVFKLPNAFAPFPHSLTRGGILPEHKLAAIDPSRLRGHPFNVSEPVGSGPFAFKDLSGNQRQQQLSLVPNSTYYLGTPGLDGLVLRTFEDPENMIRSFRDGELATMSGLRSLHRPQMQGAKDSNWYDLPLNNAVYLFLHNQDSLLKNTKLRLALTRATNRQAILKLLEGRFVPAKGPLLQHQLGYQDDLVQYSYNPKTAAKLLDEAGWKLAKDGLRYNKRKKPLRIKLVTQSSDDYPVVAETLQKQWAKLGIDLRVELVGDDEIQQGFIVPHNYQSLLIGVTIGADPDVFPYWHASQAEAGGFNLSEYRNAIADLALETGRTRLDPDLRAAKYEPFLEQWRKDAPAIALYQPGYAYIQHIRVSGFTPHRISNPDERFNDVQNWRINVGLGDKSL